MNAKPESINWHERARSLNFRTQAFIDGRYVDAASGSTFDSINPATGKLLARVAAGDAEDINRAVASARAVFRKGSWSNLAPAKRKRLLFRFAELITKHADELALLETLDMGKPFPTASRSISQELRAASTGTPRRSTRSMTRSRPPDRRRWRRSRASPWVSSARSCPGTSHC
jgi:acyl-CoA reductase-like NAD-dependent aldehyde dehydrogenase